MLFRLIWNKWPLWRSWVLSFLRKLRPKKHLGKPLRIYAGQIARGSKPLHQYLWVLNELAFWQFILTKVQKIRFQALTCLMMLYGAQSQAEAVSLEDGHASLPRSIQALVSYTLCSLFLYQNVCRKLLMQGHIHHVLYMLKSSRKLSLVNAAKHSRMPHLNHILLTSCLNLLWLLLWKRNNDITDVLFAFSPFHTCLAAWPQSLLLHKSDLFGVCAS